MEESEKFARTVFYNSPVAKIVYVGTDMIVQEANEKMLEILNRDLSIIDVPILDSVPELKKQSYLKSTCKY